MQKKQNTDEERERKERERKRGRPEGRQLGWLEKKCSNACYMKNQEEPTTGGPRDIVGGREGGREGREENDRISTLATIELVYSD